MKKLLAAAFLVLSATNTHSSEYKKYLLPALIGAGSFTNILKGTVALKKGHKIAGTVSVLTGLLGGGAYLYKTLYPSILFSFYPERATLKCMSLLLAGSMALSYCQSWNNYKAEREKNESCAICLSSLSYCELTCGHFFHISCTYQLLQSRLQAFQPLACPLCRRVQPLEHVERIIDTATKLDPVRDNPLPEPENA